MGNPTPGPWSLSTSLEPCGNCLSRSVIGADSFVAEVLYEDEQDPTADANARLIAAAPELLAALIALIPTNVNLANLSWPDDTNIPVDISLGEFRLASAAIAKALGQ